jgi:hypothetical protein
MQMAEPKNDENFPHITNFLQAIHSRRREDLTAEVREAAISADLVHIANASYRTGSKLTLEPGVTRFAGDSDANMYLTRHPYRSPYIVS